jgi:lipopolysaccharide cholinephosphotransferase
MTKENINLEKLKKIELEIFKQFIYICEKEKLKYYILAGTLIGAIRHKGFIPWDDDIDVCMPRCDYEIFLNVAQKYLPSNYFLQTFQTEPNWPANCAKLRDSTTTFIEKCFQRFDINHGVFIDIFPLDFYPTNFWKKLYLNLKNKFLLIRIKKDYFNGEWTKEYTYKNIIRKVIFPLTKMLYPHLKDAVIAREQTIKAVKSSKFYRNWDGGWGKKEIWEENYFQEGVDINFEGITVKAPKQYDKVLRHVYGNYMELPPKEKQILKHETKVIDLNHPYTYYTKKEN